SSRGEPTALVVGEAQPCGSDLFTQDTVLFPKIVDDVALLLVEPAGERDQDELQGMRPRRHGDQPIRAKFIGALDRSVVPSIGFLDSTRFASPENFPAPWLTISVSPLSVGRSAWTSPLTMTNTGTFLSPTSTRTSPSAVARRCQYADSLEMCSAVSVGKIRSGCETVKGSGLSEGS